jgi:hypothetical protein
MKFNGEGMTSPLSSRNSREAAATGASPSLMIQHRCASHFVPRQDPAMIVTGLADQAAAIIALRDGCGAVAIRCLNKVITGNLNCRLFHFQELQSIHESL